MTKMSPEDREVLLRGGASGPSLLPVANRLFLAEDPDLRVLARTLADVGSRANWFDVGGFGRSLLLAAAAREAMPLPAMLRDLARRCHNGAPDPYQEFYDLGMSPLLDRLADALERTDRG